MAKAGGRKNKNGKPFNYHTINNLTEEDYKRMFPPDVIAQRAEEIRARWSAEEDARRIAEPSPDIRLPEGYDPQDAKRGRDTKYDD